MTNLEYLIEEKKSIQKKLSEIKSKLKEWFLSKEDTAKELSESYPSKLKEMLKNTTSSIKKVIEVASTKIKNLCSEISKLCREGIKIVLGIDDTYFNKTNIEVEIVDKQKTVREKFKQIITIVKNATALKKRPVVASELYKTAKSM